jgi:hypothetical protein
MSNTALPVRPSLEYLRKVAKDRLDALRRTRPMHSLPMRCSPSRRSTGFPSWRALKAKSTGGDRRAPSASSPRAAGRCRDHTRLLAHDPTLIALRDEEHDATGLHFAAAHVDAARLLIDAGADVNATATSPRSASSGGSRASHPPDASRGRTRSAARTRRTAITFFQPSRLGISR